MVKTLAVAISASDNKDVLRAEIFIFLFLIFCLGCSCFLA